jgi:two-component system response regulator WspF
MRIAIVNDSAMAVEAMRRVVLSGGRHLVAWTATDGEQAVDRCRHDKPDLVLMDLYMPRRDGVGATRRIMEQSPCAILVVTANVTDNCAKVFEAMGAGALDAVNTPVLEWPGSCKGASALLGKIETIGKLIGADAIKVSARQASEREQPRFSNNRLIAIGASAGGPAALARIVNYLPGNFHTPVVIVQHVDAQFAPGLASWLDDQTPLRVRLAQEGDCPSPGTILLAGRDQHLVLAGPHYLAYVPEPIDCSYRPSVDVFFQSIRQKWVGEVLGVLLTGMGRDGARGLLELRQEGHYTLAQDEASSAVFGMPKAAVELGGAAEVLSLDHIGLRLRAWGTQPINIHA